MLSAPIRPLNAGRLLLRAVRSYSSNTKAAASAVEDVTQTELFQETHAMGTSYRTGGHEHHGYPEVGSNVFLRGFDGYQKPYTGLVIFTQIFLPLTFFGSLPFVAFVYQQNKG